MFGIKVTPTCRPIAMDIKRDKGTNVQTGALFERMVYDNFIVGPRYSAAVFDILFLSSAIPRLPRKS